ncbi:MAG: CoA transferase subunit A [Promethearchaeota archaeon]
MSRENKLMDVKEAISAFINDGDLLCTANFLHSIPYALIHEIVRQQKKNLTVCSCSSIEEMDILLSGGCANKFITTYYHRAGGIRYKRELDRALLEKRAEIEDYTNFTMASRFMAGALGYEFLPVLKSVMYSDVFRIRTIEGENKFKVIKSPFSGEEVVLVPAINPDVSVVHVQRADKYGNAQMWGNSTVVKWCALSAKRIIVSCEEIVDHEKIKRSPFLTVIPSFRVSAVCEIPWGAHPSPVAGYYDTDISFRSFYFANALNKRSNENWIKEWIFDRKDRQDYINHYIERFTKEPLDALKVNDYSSDSVNLGYKQKYWRYNERIGEEFLFKFAQTREEYNQKTEEYGELDL